MLVVRLERLRESRSEYGPGALGRVGSGTLPETSPGGLARWILFVSRMLTPRPPGNNGRQERANPTTTSSTGWGKVSPRPSRGSGRNEQECCRLKSGTAGRGFRSSA
ncbi:hypothetical protein Tco_1476196 [Tanacetum coccineum]